MMNIFPAGSTGLRSKTDDVMRNIFGRTQHDSQASAEPHGSDRSAGAETLQCLEGSAQVSQG